jgi:hypothetical protein
MKAPLEILASKFSIALAMIVIVNAWARLDHRPIGDHQTMLGRLSNGQ